jgi:large subunit ribosomal protein L3
MTRIFDDKGRHVPVSVLVVGDCRVVAVKSSDGADGYSAVQLGSGHAREKNVKKPVLGHIKKSGLDFLPKVLKEFRVSPDCALAVGDSLLPSHFVAGQFVDVAGITIGRGYQGGMKRWGFRGLEASHGVSVSHRSLGSTGQRQDPGKVFKNKKMPGRMGGKTVTMQNLRVVEANDAEGFILVKGAVPGSDGSMVFVRDAAKRPLPKDAPLPAGIIKAGKSDNVDNAGDAAVEAQEPAAPPAAAMPADAKPAALTDAGE